MSSSNRESISFVAESSFGVTPGSPTGQLIEFTDTTIGQTNDTTNSNTVRSDTNRAGTIRTAVNPGGDLGIEWQFEAYDPFLEAVFRNTFPADIAFSASTVSAASADNSFNDSGSEFGSVVAGQWIRVGGFATNPVNNGLFRVTTATSAKLVVTGATLITEAAGDTITMTGALMKNATTEKSFTFERNFEDIVGGQFISVTGMRVTDFNLTFPLTSIGTGTISYLAKIAAEAQSTIMTGGFTPAISNPKINTINNISAIYIDNVLSTSDFTQIDLNITTNSEALKKIGALEAIDVDQRSIGVTGTIAEYFEDNDLLSKNLDFTSFKFAFVTEDDDGNGYVFDLQEVKITGGNPDNPGIDQTIQAPWTYEAVLDTTTAATISVTKVPV